MSWNVTSSVKKKMNEEIIEIIFSSFFFFLNSKVFYKKAVFYLMLLFFRLCNVLWGSVIRSLVEALNIPLIYECLRLYKGGDACAMTIQSMKALSAVYEGSLKEIFPFDPFKLW